MFGFDFLDRRKRSTLENSKSPAGPGVVLISDYIGSYNDSESVADGVAIVADRQGGIKVIRTDVMKMFTDKHSAVQKIFRDAIVGKCDGMFPVTNPAVNNVYYYPVDNKYYKCKTGHTGAVIKPDDKFEEFSLLSISNSKLNKISLTGAAKGSANVDNSGNIEINTTINYNDISGKPSSMKNPNTLVLQLNGKNQTAYDGSTAVTINITPQNIGAQPAGSYAASNHNHDTVYAKISHVHSEYQPKGEYALRDHNHNGVYAPVNHNHDYLPLSGGTLTGVVITPNDSGFKYKAADGTDKWLISNTGGHEIALGYTGNGQDVIVRAYNEIYAMNDKKVWHSGNLNPNNYSLSSHNHNGVYQPVGNYSVEGHKHDDLYQPKGSYASSSHNHDSVYSKLNHTHTISGINMTGYSKGTTPGSITTSDTLGVAIGKLEISLENKQPKGNYAASNHNHDTVYAPKSHNHNDLYNTKTEVTNLLKGYSPTTHNHDDKYQLKGNYALNNHVHNSGQITAMTGYVKATTVTDIAPTDSMNVAIGKLEKALEGKQAAGSYAPSNHNHNTLYYGKGEIDTKLGGYSPTTHNHDNNYAAKTHNHNDLYNTKTEVTNLLAGKLDKTANAASASKLATGRTIAINGAVNGSVVFDGSANATISTTLAGFDAGKITSGVISVDRLPKTALSEFVAVANRDARLKLTKTQVQNGDTVKETDTKRMFLVIDDTKLNVDAGYQEYTTVVDWASITGKPSTFNPSTHNHTWTQISDRPTSMVNPHGLTISLNGKAQTVYTGASAVSFNITPASIGAQVAGNYASGTHNHDTIYAKISHTHSEYQPKGNYADTNHNHDSVYAKLSHTHNYLPLSGGSVTGNIISSYVNSDKAFASQYGNKSPFYNEFTTTGTSEYYPMIKQKYTVSGKSGTWSIGTLINTNTLAIHHIGSDGSDNKVFEFTKDGYIKIGGSRVWHSGNFDPASKAAINHNHDTAYAKLNHIHSDYQPKGNYAASNHTHDDRYYTEGEINTKLAGYQPKGNYAASNHTHDDRYFTENEINGKLTGYSLTSHNHDNLYAPKSHTHDMIVGNYTGSGGQKPPSYIPSARIRFNMMNTPVNGNSSYKDWILMDTYGGLDVPVVTGFGITKSSELRAFIMNGPKGGTDWSKSAEIWTTENFNPSSKADVSHTHSEYQPKGSYAPTDHNHNGVYQPAGSYAASSHTHNIVKDVGNAYDITFAYSKAGLNWGEFSWLAGWNGYELRAVNKGLFVSSSGGTINGSLTVTGQILSNADVVAYSDARFKTNIRVIDTPLEKIGKINGYYYDMMGVENEHQVGVLAQELQKVLPEAVFEDKNGHLGVRYTNIVPVLIEGVKQLVDENKQLKDRLDRIEKLLLQKGV